MDKFPSTTTLWLLLRKFEAGVAGDGGSQRNLTARGVPSTDSGEGRLYHEQPVLQVMNRELSSLTDLQKNLAQLGLNSGSALIRLSYRRTDTPLEEAMAQIQQYFDSVDGTRTAQPQQQPTPAAGLPQTPETTDTTQSEHAAKSEPESIPPEVLDTTMTEASTQLDGTAQTSQPISPTTSRPLSVYRPPSASIPSAALTQHYESDYTPTVEHAQVHQKMLSQSTRNVRLPTEAEIARQAQDEADKLAAIKEVEIKIRFPDQSAVSSTFGQMDTGKTLYNFIRADCLEPQWRSEPFVLRNPGIKPGQKGDTIPDSDRKLIQQLLLKGRVLVVFEWQDGASIQARGAKSVLKEELTQVAVEVKVQDVAGKQPEEIGIKVNLGKKDDEGEEKSGGLGKKMPKWLKGLAKK
jgi:tether containing UBX domain for GLUT4